MKQASALVPLIALACASATPPERPEPYEYVMGRLADGFPLVFHWPRASLPVRVWVETDAIRLPVADAIRVWEAVALYGEFRGVLVRDSSVADVIFSVGPSRPLPAPNGTNDRLNCSAEMPFFVLARDTTMLLPFRITVAPRAGADTDEVARCFASVTASWLGRALGLLADSDDPADLIYPNPTATTPSPRDGATFAALYHSRPTVGLPPER